MYVFVYVFHSFLFSRCFNKPLSAVEYATPRHSIARVLIVEEIFTISCLYILKELAFLAKSRPIDCHCVACANHPTRFPEIAACLLPNRYTSF